MSCRYTYKGETYEAWEFEDVLLAMPPSEASAFMPDVKLVAEAPFVTKTEGWLNLALKRVMVMAAEGGYDKVAFVNGDQSAERYDLSKQVERIDYNRNGDGTYNLSAIKNSTEVFSKERMSLGDIEDTVGKDIAKKIEAGEGRAAAELDPVDRWEPEDDIYREFDYDKTPVKSLSGLDLKVGGEGMKAFYDKIVPTAVKKLLPKVGGGQLGVVEIDGAGTQPGFDVTDKMRDQVEEGLPMFANRATTGSGWNMLPDTVGDRVVQFLSRGHLNAQILQDGRHDLYQAQRSIKAAGGVIPEHFDARMAETLMPGRIKARLDNFLELEAKPLIEAMKRNKISQDELSDYLLARHAPERNAQIASINPAMPDGGAGTNSQGVLMTTQAAQDHINNLSPGKRTALQLMARQVDAITQGTRDLLRNEGLEDPKSVDAWERTYQHYVPLFRDEATSGEVPSHPMGRGIDVRGSASRRAMGSTKEVTNMLAHVLIAREAAITRAEKNLVGQAIYGLALTQPNTDFWQVLKPNMSKRAISASLQAMGVSPAAIADMELPPTIRTIDKATGLVVHRTNTQYKKLPNALVVKVNGEDRVVLFNQDNPHAQRLIANLKNQDSVGWELARKLWAPVTRFISKTLTQWNPVFGAANAIKDAIGASVNLSSTLLKGQQLAVFAHLPSAIVGIARELRNDAQRTPMADLYRQYRMDGAETGFRDNNTDPYGRAEEINALLADSKVNPTKVLHAFLDLMSDFNHALENGIRLAAYKVALDKGASRPMAAKLARELTVDFNRKGSAGSDIGVFYAFFNASVQGTERTLQTLASPAGKKILAGGLAVGVAQALVLALAGFDDDEIPEFEKSRSLIIPTGGKNYAKIPLPPGLHVLPNTGRVLTELAMGSTKDLDKRMFKALGEIVGAFNPLGGGNPFTAHGLLTTVLPTALDPVADLAANRNFADKPISKETGPYDPRPGYLKGRESTMRTASGQAYAAVAQGINAVGGGEFRKGYLSPTPEEIRFIVHAVGGGLSKQLQDVIDTTVDVAKGGELKAKSIPLGGRFSGTVDYEELQRSRFFKNKDAISSRAAEYKALSKDGQDAAAAKLMRDRPEAGLSAINDYINRKIAKLNKAAAENLADRAELKSLDAARVEYMRALNDAVLELEKASDKAKKAQELSPEELETAD